METYAVLAMLHPCLKYTPYSSQIREITMCAICCAKACCRTARPLCRVLRVRICRSIKEAG